MSSPSTGLSRARSAHRARSGASASTKSTAQLPHAHLQEPQHETLLVVVRGRRAADPPQTLLWDTARPQPLGHPFQWVLERVADGVRARDVSAALGVVNSSQPVLISGSELRARKNHVLKAASGRELRVMIALPEAPRPAYAEAVTGKRQGDRNRVRAFLCRGSWIVSGDEVTGAWTARRQDTEIFQLVADETARLSSRMALRWERGEKSGSLAAGETLSFPLAELSDFSVSAGADTWRFAVTIAVDLPVSPAGSDAAEARELESFKRTLKGSGIGALLFIALCFLWPTPEVPEEEVIPEEYAKILMQPAAPASAAQEMAADPATRAEDTAVTQALKSEAVQTAISGLLKSGMTQLLAQSAFSAANTAGARSLFEATRAPGAVDLKAQAAGHDAVKVAAVGGAQGGYAKGAAGAVSGQGTGTISLDMEGSQVEEGLSKDEVGKVIHAHMNEVRYCYDTALIRSPDVEGKLVVNFAIGKEGSVTRSAVQSSTAGDPRLDDCILRRLGRWKFPQPKGGVTVAVSYPFIFKTLGR
ncbi:MAG: TonB family protein [Bdellovibrionales bacterium]|nr:TonB family protein [Bdellovibrionales bacterium]